MKIVLKYSTYCNPGVTNISNCSLTVYINTNQIMFIYQNCSKGEAFN